MNWTDVRGHQEQVQMFRQAAQRGRLSHAYLFVGADGIGKHRFARVLAQTLLCDAMPAGNPHADAPAPPRLLDPGEGDDGKSDRFGPCETCPACRQVQADSHPDFYTVGCPRGRSELPIEVFLGPPERRGKTGLCYELSLCPMAGGRKIAIIDDANLMNEESANALLKTLEEPPPHSVLILIAENLDGILATIRSRCQLVRFAPLPAKDVADLLLETEMLEDRQEAETVASLSEGSVTLAGQLIEPALRRVRESVYDGLARQPLNPLKATSIVIGGLEELGGDSIAQRRYSVWIVRFCIQFFRMAVLRLSGQRVAAVAQVEQFLERFDGDSPEAVELVIEMFDRVVLTEDQLSRNQSIPLCFEALFDDLARQERSVLA